MTTKSTNIPNLIRSQECVALDADILSNMRLAAEFYALAQHHYDIFDTDGYLYCVEKHLAHARLVSEYIKKLKKMEQKS